MICATEKFAQRFSQKPEDFSDTFGEIRAKIFLTPKNLPASTPMAVQKSS